MKNLYILFILTVLLCLISCSFESDDIITDDTTEQYDLYDYYIDEYGNEGIVAYIQTKYIIVISSDESYESWGPMGETVYKGNISSTELILAHFGVSIHQAMKSIGIEKFPAQNWCDQKNKPEKYPRAGSWRLPTKRELNLIFGKSGEKVDRLNSALLRSGGYSINKNEYYWTCIEDYDGYIEIDDIVSNYDPENRAFMMTYDNATFGNKDRWIKKNKYYVRAIKYIYYRK